ncbi:MAG: hypothetical protein KBG48_17550 [Kofleriaceae bacterium]|jgi:hypothetical protein|nr:hypothetical protein [Kofleriaceae bacterium]MBP9169207.1 hypothetical protein [Kofleriaceae bacterium]MBP9859112.1 hypothetical protein [Kofleriaceae bacterium]
MRLGTLTAVLLAGACAALVPTTPAAQAQCRVIEVDTQPSPQVQVVAWLEDTAGNFIATMYITDAVGRRGIGNRPGRYDFNSGPMWPYGRRITTFPIWAHRHGLEFPQLIFQDRQDSNLSHGSNQSSIESFFCRPIKRNEAAWDTATCASASYTDKGMFDPTVKSKYPPREDITRVPGLDHEAVAMFDDLNPFDSVSQATPPGNAPHSFSWPMPRDLPPGDYVVHVEVAKEFDHNLTYSEERYPAPNVFYGDYGLPYRGQPSVLYRLPVRIGTAATEVAMTLDYAGYGDPEGEDGLVSPPDATITATVPGSGASRLLVRVDGSDMFRVRVRARPEEDAVAPGPAAELVAADIDVTSSLVTFVAPGDDGALGKVAGYEVRYRAHDPITEATFGDATPLARSLDPDDAGQVQSFELTGLLPQTTYHVAIRAFDECRNYGPLTTTSFTTLERTAGEVDACFVATAAYGTALANEVTMLRQFRDAALRRSVLGELFVGTYYTVGPVFATMIDQSEALRAAARAGLNPVVAVVGRWK